MYANDSLFNFQSSPISNFDPGQIQNADLVVLEGISTLDGETKLAIETFLSDGGSVAISPSDNPSVQNLQAF